VHPAGLLRVLQQILTLRPAGWIFIILAVTGVRGKLIQLAPRSLMLATSAGIGMFLAFIGLQTSNGLGVVTYESATLVTLGACPMADREHSFTGPASSLFCPSCPSLLCRSRRNCCSSDFPQTGQNITPKHMWWIKTAMLTDFFALNTGAPMYVLTQDAAAQVCNATAAAAAGATIPNLGNASSNTQCRELLFSNMSLPAQWSCSCRLERLAIGHQELELELV
jgi:hypothetical protein